jgi:3-oxoacyl-[acyl-carrier-protein] synthase-3
MDDTDVHILAVGTALPGPPVDNAALARRFGMPAVWQDWVEMFVGTRTRHFAVDLDTGEVEFSLADIAETAGRRAMAAAAVDAADVELIVMGTSSPDMLMPATVNLVADRLGIDGIPTFQLQSGCAGAVQAIDVAREMVRSGRYRTALVLGADSCAKHLDVTIDPNTLAPAEQVNGVLFGDGAGAAVLSTRPAPGAAVLRGVKVELAGRGRLPGQVVEWFGRADRDTDRAPVLEDYKAIEESVPVLAADILAQLLEQLDWKDTEIGYLLPPQLSGRMTARITEHLGLTAAREVSCVADIGNTGNALPFFQLELALPLMSAGDRAVAVAIESSKWIKAAFGLEKV